jgi:tRNA(Ile2) C34 agmatinyltransferase TiaS
MSIREKIQKEGPNCPFCRNKMKNSDDIPQAHLGTDGFICPMCGFVAFFVRTDRGDYFGVTMERSEETN